MKYIKTYESLSDLIEFQKCIGKYAIFLLKFPDDTRGAGTTGIYLCKVNEIGFTRNVNGDSIYYLNGKIYQILEQEKETWYDFQNLDITDLTFIKSFDTDVEAAKSEYLSMIEAEKYNL